MLLNLSEIYDKDSPIFFPYYRRAFRSEVVSASNSISSTAFTTAATIAIFNAGDFPAAAKLCSVTYRGLTRISHTRSVF